MYLACFAFFSFLSRHDVRLCIAFWCYKFWLFSFQALASTPHLNGFAAPDITAIQPLFGVWGFYCTIWYAETFHSSRMSRSAQQKSSSEPDWPTSVRISFGIVSDWDREIGFCWRRFCIIRGCQFHWSQSRRRRRRIVRQPIQCRAMLRLHLRLRLHLKIRLRLRLWAEEVQWRRRSSNSKPTRPKWCSICINIRVHDNFIKKNCLVWILVQKKSWLFYI